MHSTTTSRITPENGRVFHREGNGNSHSGTSSIVEVDHFVDAGWVGDRRQDVTRVAEGKVSGSGGGALTHLMPLEGPP